MSSRYITIMAVPDGDANPRRLRLPVWLYRTLLIVLLIIVLAPGAYVLLYYDIVSKAADADRLLEENESLRRYQYKVQILEQSLLESKQLISKVAAMAGLDSLLISDLYGESDSLGSDQTPRWSPGSISRTLPPTSPIPDGLPATGWISRGFSRVPGKFHDGVDLALAEGSSVYSTAFGEVTFAGWDDIYGNEIIVRNNDSIETVYGHNSKLMVQVGDTIFAGQVVALSGNTGQSSAPHLHYEIRIHGEAVNPIKYFVYENND